jgi:hypothetical protein
VYGYGNEKKEKRSIKEKQHEKKSGLKPSIVLPPLCISIIRFFRVFAHQQALPSVR